TPAPHGSHRGCRGARSRSAARACPPSRDLPAGPTRSAPPPPVDGIAKRRPAEPATRVSPRAPRLGERLTLGRLAVHRSGPENDSRRHSRVETALQDSAARELMTATQARRRPSVPTPIPAVYVAERGHEPSRAVVPVVGVLSLLAHGAVLAIFAALPPPSAHAGLGSEPLVLVPFEAEPVAIAEPPPEPIVEEVVEPPPPEPAAAIVERPRPRPAPVRRDEAPDPAPAPPAEVLTASAGGAGDWSH